jgi:hypothetical protein
MSIYYRALLHGKLEISTSHGSVTNYYVISLMPILVVLLILGLVVAAVLTLCQKSRK